jgi:hypothetical protein
MVAQYQGWWWLGDSFGERLKQHGLLDCHKNYCCEKDEWGKGERGKRVKV